MACYYPPHIFEPATFAAIKGRIAEQVKVGKAYTNLLKNGGGAITSMAKRAGKNGES